MQKGKTAFVLFLDVVVLNYDGSILDAALLAAVSSLQHRASYSPAKLMPKKRKRTRLIEDRISEITRKCLGSRYGTHYLCTPLANFTRSSPESQSTPLLLLIRSLQWVRPLPFFFRAKGD